MQQKNGGHKPRSQPGDADVACCPLHFSPIVAFSPSPILRRAAGSPQHNPAPSNGRADAYCARVQEGRHNMSEITNDLTARSTLQYVQYAQVYYAGVQQSVVNTTGMTGSTDEKVAFVNAQSLLNRTADLVTTKEALDRAIGATGAAGNALSGMREVVSRMKSVVESARNTGGSEERAALQVRYEELTGQLDELADTAEYDGINLLEQSGGAEAAQAGLTINLGSETAVIHYRPTDAAALGIGGQSPAGASGTLSEDAARISADWGAVFENDGDISRTGAAAEEAFTAMLAGLEAAESRIEESEAYYGAQKTSLQSYAGNVLSFPETSAGQAAGLPLPDSSQVRASIVAMETREQLGHQALNIMGMQQIGLLGLIL